MTLYDIKPKFQALLRPFVEILAKKGVTANQVTLFAAFGSISLGILLYLFANYHQLFLLMPLWMLIRMALNAVDGMLAREFGQQSTLGHYLNELSDVVADTALYIPFLLISPFTSPWVCLVIFLSILSEFSGVLGSTIGASRRYDGPMGKSDRAFLLALIGLWLGIVGSLPEILYWLMPVLAVLLSLTIYNRISRALKEIK